MSSQIIHSANPVATTRFSVSAGANQIGSNIPDSEHISLCACFVLCVNWPTLLLPCFTSLRRLKALAPTAHVSSLGNMAVSKAEKLKLLFKDDLIEGQLPKLPVASGENQQETSPKLPSIALVDSIASHTNSTAPKSYTSSHGEDIEPVGCSSHDEKVLGAGSTTTSGKRKVEKRGRQSSVIIGEPISSIRPVENIDSTLDPGLRRGELAPLGEKFCPILAVSRYPYRHLGKDLSEIVADCYFNAGKFWERSWDM